MPSSPKGESGAGTPPLPPHHLLPLSLMLVSLKHLTEAYFISSLFQKQAMFKLFRKQPLQGVYEEVSASSDLLSKGEKEEYDVEEARIGERLLSVTRLLFPASLFLLAFSILVLIAAWSIRPSDNQCARQLSVWCKSSQRASEVAF